VFAVRNDSEMRPRLLTAPKPFRAIGETENAACARFSKFNPKEAVQFLWSKSKQPQRGKAKL
jgi:hypothetical protein